MFQLHAGVIVGGVRVEVPASLVWEHFMEEVPHKTFETYL